MFNNLKMNRIKMLVAAGAMVILGVPSVFSQDSDSRVLMSIADENVTVGDFMYVYSKNNLNKEENSQQAIREYLDLYINFRLKVKEAVEMGLDTSQSFKKELDGYRKQLAQPYFKDDAVSEKLLEEAYQRKLWDIRASHLLIRVDKNAEPADTLAAYNKALDIRKRFLAGEDFGKLAAQYSDDPSARDTEATQYRPAKKGNKGDLGYFSVFDMVYPFESGAYNTEVGSVSNPVRTDYGYHLIKVTDKQPALGQGRVAHIYVAMPPNSSKQDSLQKKMKIDQAYQKILQGQSFTDAVKEFSEDKGSVANGGLLPWFTSNKMVPEFIVATRSLKDTGEISQPFLTSFGWHIIKLIDRKPVGTFEDEKFELKNKLDKDQRMALSQEVVIKRIKDEYGFKENTKAREALLAKMDSTLLKGEWTVDKAAGLDKVVMSIGDAKYTQQDLAKYIAEKQNKRATDITLFFNETYGKFRDEKVLAYEDARLEQKYPEFRMLMQEYHDGILLFDLTDKKVWSKAVKDTTGLKEYYNNHQADYMWDKRLSAMVVTVLHPQGVNMDQLRALVESGADVETVLSKFNSDTLTNILAEVGKFPKGDNTVIDAIKWKTGLSTNVDTKDGVAFAYVYELVKPEPKTLDEARGLVTADYQNYLEKQWIEELKAKYPVVVNEEVLSTLK
jgi:peptidyl-prolyl cis-trans isomerase SurA